MCIIVETAGTAIFYKNESFLGMNDYLFSNNGTDMQKVSLPYLLPI